MKQPLRIQFVEIKSQVPEGKTASEPVEVPFPMVLDGEEYAEVTMRPPKGKDLRILAAQASQMQIKDQFSIDLLMIAHLCDFGVTPEAFDDVDAYHIRKLQAGLASFL